MKMRSVIFIINSYYLFLLFFVNNSKNKKFLSTDLECILK